MTSTADAYSTLDQPTCYRDLVRRVGALPGVTPVGIARYFGTIPISWSDAPGSLPVVLVSDSLARLLEPEAGPVREILRNMGHEQVVVMSTIDGLFENWLVAERMGATAATVLALCIACVGIYALLAYAVARRTRDIGVRIAVGATARDVSSLVVRDALVLTGAGVSLGIPAALLPARALESLMYGVTTGDMTTLIESVGLLTAIAVSATVVPVWRALRVDPMIALRAE